MSNVVSLPITDVRIHVLAPCPFCGDDDPDLEHDPAAGSCGDGGEWWVQCSACQCRGPSSYLGCRDDEDDNGVPLDFEKEAVDMWNERVLKVST
jgi:hypothetical protein